MRQLGLGDQRLRIRYFEVGRVASVELAEKPVEWLGHRPIVRLPQRGLEGTQIFGYGQHYMGLHEEAFASARVTCVRLLPNLRDRSVT